MRENRAVKKNNTCLKYPQNKCIGEKKVLTIAFGKKNNESLYRK